MNTLAGPFAIGAVLLVVGGAFKARRPGDTARALQAVGVRASWSAVRLGAVAECAIGIAALVSGLALFPALVAISYLVFAGFVVLALRSGAPISSCGCFGKVDTPPSAVHVVIDAALVGVAAAVAIVGTDVSMPEVLPDQPLAGVPFVFLVVLGSALVFLSFTSLPRTLAAARAASR